MEIHRLAHGDVARFKAIRLASLREAPGAFGTTFEDASSWPPDLWTKLFSKIVVFVAVAGGSDVGIVRGAADRDVENAARLGSLWVAPEVRGARVATALVDSVVEWARSSGFADLLLDVSDDNGSGIGFYRRSGFKPTGEVSHLPPPRQHLGIHQQFMRL